MKTLKNRVQLIGNLGMDPEVKDLGGNRKMARLNLATTESYRGADGKRKEDTQWHRIIAWGPLASLAERYLRKGRRIAVEGKLVYRRYENKSGQQRFVAEVVATDFVMLDGRKEE